MYMKCALNAKDQIFLKSSKTNRKLLILIPKYSDAYSNAHLIAKNLSSNIKDFKMDGKLTYQSNIISKAWSFTINNYVKNKDVHAHCIAHIILPIISTEYTTEVKFISICYSAQIYFRFLLKKNAFHRRN